MKKKFAVFLILLLVLAAGGAISQYYIKEKGFSQKQIPCREVENEMEAATGVHLKLEGRVLTYAQVDEILEKLHLGDYITYDAGYGAKKVSRDAWHEVYRDILDYLDSGKNVDIREVLVLGTNKKKTKIYTSEGTFSSQGVKTKELEQYKLYVSDQKVLGIIEKKEGRSTLANAYLKSYKDKKVTVLFDGREYDFSAGASKKKMENVVCDIVFDQRKIREIHTKEESITGNLVTLDEQEIEIEGYGKIPLAKRVPAYKLYGTLEEKSLEDIVIGNMSVEYVVGKGKVQAVLLKEPADIEQIRVLILNGNTPYYGEAYFSSEKKITLQRGKKSKTYKAGKIFAAKKLLGEGKAESCRLIPEEGGQIYLTDKDGNRISLGYAGNMELRRTPEGYTVVNEVSFEDYICGVLPSEMPEKFDKESLKAQAVCARSYAYRQLMKGDYAALGAHIDDSTNYQVYNKKEVGEKSRLAVQDTAGQVLKYQGNVIEAYYYSTSFGHTGTMEDWNQKDDGSYGYLQNIWVREKQKKTDLSKEKNFRQYISKPDDACYDGKTAYFRWKASFDFNGKDEAIRNLLTEMKNSNSKNIQFSAGEKKKKTLKGFGAVTNVTVEKRGKSGAIAVLQIDFENGKACVRNEYNIRKVLGAALTEITYQDGRKAADVTVLPSAYCTLEYDGAKKMAESTGGGFGHGIGMSQYGADGMAKAGYTYDEILQFFYHDVKIEGIY